jgi:hypothetical protein
MNHMVHNAPAPMAHGGPTRALVIIAFAANIGYQVLMAAQILLRPELDPATKPISEYAIGRLGWVTVIAFLSSAVSYGALLLALRPLLRDAAGRVGLVLLLICTLGTVGVGVFVADPITQPFDKLSAHGTAHAITGTLALLLLPAAAVLINRSAVRLGAWSTLTRSTLVWTSWLTVVGLAYFCAATAFIVPAEGWPPRELFLAYTVWLVVLAVNVVRAPFEKLMAL